MALIGTDPNPEYSNLDRLDGLPRAVHPYDPEPGERVTLVTYTRQGDGHRIEEYDGWFISDDGHTVRWGFVPDWADHADGDEMVLAWAKADVVIHKYRHGRG